MDLKEISGFFAAWYTAYSQTCFLENCYLGPECSKRHKPDTTLLAEA